MYGGDDCAAMPITPAQFAADRGFSERAVRKKARQLGACRILGRTMSLEDEDVRAILEALRPCPSPSIDAPAERPGTTAAPLAALVRGRGYEEALALLTKPSPNRSPVQLKRGTGKVVSMVRPRS